LVTCSQQTAIAYVTDRSGHKSASDGSLKSLICLKKREKSVRVH